MNCRKVYGELRRRRIALMLCGIWLASPAAFGQFLRIGPFDFDAKLRAGAVYSSNIERERKSEATLEREDYYVLAGFDLASTAPLNPTTTLRIDTGMTLEKHFVREDLDNSTAPFGRALVNLQSELDRFTLRGEVSWSRQSESREDTFIPGGGAERNPNTRLEYLAGIEWMREFLRIGTDYRFTQERYEKEKFKEGDRDGESWNSSISLRLTERIDTGYRHDRSRDKLVGRGEKEFPDWDINESFFISFLLIRDNPRLSYTLRYEREKNQGVTSEWEPTHTLDVADDWEISPTLRFSVSASYTYEENPEEDDISFTYSAAIEHQISDRTRQRLGVQREPRRTFGSTTDTDTTSWLYDLSIRDVFLPELMLGYSLNYSIDKPVGEPESTTLSQTFMISHSRDISYRLKRIIRYTYSWEDDSEEDEILDEHRVEWLYEMTL